jgi:hypothetical protein
MERINLCHKKINQLYIDEIHTTFFVAVLLCWVTQDFELYAAFDPLADKVQFSLIFLISHILLLKIYECSSPYVIYQCLGLNS